MHSSLRELHRESINLSNALEKSKIDRQKLDLPNTSQIQKVVDHFKAENFSIRSEIDKMYLESQKTRQITDTIKEARQQSVASSSLPLFVLASCAAVMFIVISKSQ